MRPSIHRGIMPGHSGRGREIPGAFAWAGGDSGFRTCLRPGGGRTGREEARATPGSRQTMRPPVAPRPGNGRLARQIVCPLPARVGPPRGRSLPRHFPPPLLPNDEVLSFPLAKSGYGRPISARLVLGGAGTGCGPVIRGAAGGTNPGATGWENRAARRPPALIGPGTAAFVLSVNPKRAALGVRQIPQGTVDQVTPGPAGRRVAGTTRRHRPSLCCRTSVPSPIAPLAEVGRYLPTKKTEALL